MTYAEYRDLKNSGIKWLQDIPSHWRIKRLKFSTELVNDKVSVEESSLPYLGLEHIESWTGRRIFGEIANSEGLASAFSTGDLLFGKLRPYLAKVHLAEQEGLISSEALVIRSKAEVHSAFLKYYMLSRDFINIVDSSTYGSKMPRANWDFIGNLPLLLPELEEQQAIARFLDFKTAQIDALIAKKQALLDKLAEKRTALISHAVTKGLDPSVPMKDSGVAWLGEIPAHWTVCLLKRISQITYGVGGEIDRSLTEGTNLLSLPNITKDGTLLIDEISHCELSDSEKKNLLLEKGDLLFNWRNGSSEHLGKAAFFNLEGEWTHVSFLLRIRFDLTKSEPRFFQYMLTGLRITGFFSSSKAGVNNTFNMFELANLFVIRPPIEEQHSIADELDRKLSFIEIQAKKISSVIERLTEYRSALITNAVTGKIDVRAWQPNQEAA
jgi:type I restriction enzyme S subunit